MKVKIEDFLLAMGEYCKEHDVEECLQGKCGLSVDMMIPEMVMNTMDVSCLDVIIRSMQR